MAEQKPFEPYCGRSRATFDGSYRMLVPKEWRLEGGPTQFVVIPWPFEKDPADYLLVLPLERYEKMCRSLIEKSVFDEAVAAFKRVLASSAKRVEFDKFGRIALSQALLAEVGIRDEAELVGAMDHFEIWSPERFASSRSRDKEVVAQIKPTVMG